MVCLGQQKKSMMLPAGYKEWIKNYKYPDKNVVIRTLDGRMFNVVNRFFLHHKMMNTVPSYHVVIRSCTKGKWFVRMEEIDSELYITTGWNRIKKEMSITDKHLVVFEMVDIRTFEMSVFCCDPPLLSYPPELCVVKEEPTYDLVEISDDEYANQFADVNVQHNEAKGVPVNFRVDNHYICININILLS